MRLRFHGVDVPYPIAILRGRLRLCGLSHRQVSDVLDESIRNLDSVSNPSLDNLLNRVRKSLETLDATVQADFEILTKYEELRGTSLAIPSLLVILEGASATGKSIIALELMNNLIATRFISSDTVRQVLRSILSEETHPEIYCHTYQAHIHRQVGPKSLAPVVRGYLAQCEIITPEITSMSENILLEGALGVVEGVHIIPGKSQDLSPGVIEMLINPVEETHRLMFTSKLDAEKLRTVSKDITTREHEFEGTREIQEYMLKLALNAKVPVIEMNNFEVANREVSKIILKSVRKLVSDFD